MGSESESTTTDNMPLKSLGKYLIERKLGQGGMGTVYLARHADLKKKIALKVLPKDKAKNQTLVKRFKAEAQAAAQLDHPNIVAVYDAGEADGYLYIAMEFVDGVDLFEHLKRRHRIPVKRSIEIIKSVAAALQHAFEQNIVHRDIKPSNLLLRTDGTVKVTDLGLARSVDDTLETNITRAGTTVGTVDYMAPEQARNSKLADIRSDIYSLGCTWYQMLTGQPPYPEGSLTNKLSSHAIKPLPNPRELNETVPEGVLAILQRMTAKRPDDRYQTPAELLDDINRSTLTRAAFSREILSDLDDDGTDEADDDDFDNDFDEERDEAEDVHDSKGVKRRRSRVDEDDVDEEDKDAPAGAKRRTRPGENEKESDGSVRRKPAAKGRGDQSEESSGTKRKRTASDRDADSATTKSGKLSPTKSDIEQKLSKTGARPLPPKRQPIVVETQRPALFNVEAFRTYGFIAAIIVVICALGSLLFRSTGPTEQTNSPPIGTQVAPAPPPKSTPEKPADQPESEPTSTAGAERPSGEFDIAKHPLPPWATTDAPLPADLPKLTVGPGPKTTTHFSDINEALKAAEKSGGILQLQGIGPFLLAGAELRTAKRLVITAAAPNETPLIIVQQTGPTGLGLTVINGELDLRSVHFILNQTSSTTPSSGAMISVAEGQLFVRNCSFSSMGDKDGSVSALSFVSQQDSHHATTLEPRLYLDRVMVRGNGITGLRIHRATVNAIIRDSLFVTGTGPAIDVTGQLAAASMETAQGVPKRLIRVLRSTLCARKHLMNLTVENTIKPPSTAILFQDSVCSAEGTGNGAVLASAKWPSVTTNPAGWLTNLSWTSISSLYLGFEQLLDIDKSSYDVTEPEAWQRVWCKKFDPNQFQKILWQESSIADLSSVSPSEFDNIKLPYREIKTAKGELPGCPVNQIKAPAVISQTRLLAISERSKPPAIVNQPIDTSQARKVDLTKGDDLGQILSRPDWQSGAVFEASGAGPRLMSPVKISGRSVQIVFRQTDGPPLRILPKMPDSKTKQEISGLMTIENGLLDIQSLVFEAGASATKGPGAPWMISAKDSTVILRGCSLSGPQQPDADQYPGLIQWNSTPDTSSSNKEPPFLSVNDSVLLSNGTGIKAECSGGCVFVRNSIIAIRGYGMNLIPIHHEHESPAMFDLDHVTFSTSKAAFRIEGFADATDDATTPARLFVDNSAIVTPLEFKEGEAAGSAVVDYSGPLETKYFEWWGDSNGFTNDVKILIRQMRSSPVTTPAGWKSIWGDSSDLRLLTDPKGVQLMTKSLPTKWFNIKAASFALDPDCAAATWAVGSRPIGADIHAIEDAITPKKVSKDPKAGTTKNSPPTKKNQPSNQSGF